MSQSAVEIAKEITIAAIQNGDFKDKRSAGSMSVDELNKFNAEQIGLFLKAISKHVNDAMGGNY
ncbi:GTPase-activating protein [Paenibacillus rhizolycopersici]|uniref:GTPase-activating protein n=1 Tax=Paenibacillus rhizolycopersici TaxID=2780073 RepID=UPI003D2C3700